MTEQKDLDAMLMALADGELPMIEAVEMRARIARDPSLAERFALFVETRALVAPAPSGAGAAVPDRLAEAIRAADRALRPPPGPQLTVIEGSGRAARPAVAPAAAPRARPSWAPAWTPSWTPSLTPALAAGLALCVGGALGYAVGLGGGRDVGGPGGGIAVAVHQPAAAQALAAALESGASASEVAWSDPASGQTGKVALIATHRLADGRFCREYDLTTAGSVSVVGVSCRTGGAWRTELAAARAPAGDGYATASGEGAAEQHLLGLGSAGALSEDEEKAAIANGWGR